jgi:hypothetical protein
MKSRKPLLKSLLAKFRKTAAATEPTPRPRPRKPAERKVVSTIEGLEGRIAPATLLPGATTVTFTDADGDLVTVKFSKPILTSAVVANAVLKFSSGDGAVNGSNTALEQLQLIDLIQIATAATGTSITISAEQAGAGNGVADVGQIRANGAALGAVKIDGDLGQIDAGRAGVKTALASLEVGSLGVRGLDTQSATSTTRELVSSIAGGLGSVKIHGDMKEARITVSNGSTASGITPLGHVGSIVIEGSLLGATAVGAASNNTGRIDAVGNIGSVRIGTDASDGIFGGGGTGAGQISAGGKMGNVTVSGKLVGGAGASSGMLFANATMGAVKIGIDATGGITGGVGQSSGSVQAGGAIASVAVLGDVRGGDGLGSGLIFAGASLSKVTISGDLAGGVGENSGRVQANTTLGAVSIGDDLIAGTGLASGGISAPSLGTITVQDIDGRTASAAQGTAGIAGGALKSLLVTGSIFGGSAKHSGFVEISGNLGAITVRGSIDGGAGEASASIVALGKIGSVTVNGSVSGGDGPESATIVSGFDPRRAGDMGPVKVLGAIDGGAGDRSGSIRSGGALKSVQLGVATVVLPFDALKGGDGDRSGAIESQGLLGSLKIFGSIVGGAGDSSGTVRSVDRFGATGEFAGDLGVVSLTGALRGGSGVGSGGLYADGNLTSLTVGSWAGGTGAESGVVETGTGSVKPGNSGAIRVLGAMQADGTPGAGSTSLRIGGNLASLTVGGATDGATIRAWDAIGALNFQGHVSDVLVTARGQVKHGPTTDVALGRITVAGSVTDSEFLAGYRLDAAVNADAQIGAVVVTGAWTRSSLVAGVVDTDADGFGDADDTAIAGGSDRIVSRIASVIIGGTVTGSDASTADHFGFVAQKVGTFKIAGLAQTTRPVQELDATNNDVSIREVPVPVV